MLAIISTHPIQYHAAVYRLLVAKLGIQLTVIYGSDFSVSGYHDKEFNTNFAWSKDILSGYQSVFLAYQKDGGARSVDHVSARGLMRALKETKPKAAMLLGYGHSFYLVAFLFVTKARIPILFRAETTDHTPGRGILKTFIRDIILRHFYQRCSALLYIGERSYNHFRRLSVPENKLFFSPYSVDTRPFRCDEQARFELREVTRKNLGVSEGKLVFCFSGKLSRRKGAGILLHAVKGLPSEIREQVVVIFVGNGELRDTLMKIADNPPKVEARFLGFKNQDELSQYYHASDILLLPSVVSETWGLVVNEALHHGLPCVVSRVVGCANDLIEPGVTGEIFEIGDKDGQVLAIQRALKLINNLGVREKCREKVSGYNAEKAAEGIAKAYWNTIR